MVSRNDWPFQFMRGSQIRNLILLALLLALILLVLTSTIANFVIEYNWWKDRKSTRLNSSHSQISYAVFCLKKKKQHSTVPSRTTSHTSQRLWHNTLPTS